jgi:hypothetical protein
MYLEEYAKLEITLPNGNFYIITDTDIIDDTLSISSQCIDNSTFSLGCVASAQLSATIRLQNTNRYAVIGSKIKVFSKFSENADWCPRGVFTVISAKRFRDIYTISAVDNMIWLDKSTYTTDANNKICNAATKRFAGQIYNPADAFIIIVNEICGLPAETRDEIIGSMANCDGVMGTTTGARNVSLMGGEEPENMRDYVSYLAEHMAGFAYADSNGRICLKKFPNGTPTNFFEIPYKTCELETTEIADFTVDMHKITARFFNGTSCSYWHGSGYPCGNVKTEILIDNNPFQNASLKFLIIDYGQDIHEMMYETVIHNIHNQISSMIYRPFSLRCHVQHYFSLAEPVKIYDESGNAYFSVVTNISWNYRGGQDLQCAGEDTRVISQISCQSSAKRINQRTKTDINRLADRVKALEG